MHVDHLALGSWKIYRPKYGFYTISQHLVLFKYKCMPKIELASLWFHSLFNIPTMYWILFSKWISFRSDRHRTDFEYLSSLTLFIPFNFSNKVNPVKFYTSDGSRSSEGECLFVRLFVCFVLFWCFYLLCFTRRGVGLIIKKKYPPGTF